MGTAHTRSVCVRGPAKLEGFVAITLPYPDPPTSLSDPFGVYTGILQSLMDTEHAEDAQVCAHEVWNNERANVHSVTVRSVSFCFWLWNCMSTGPQ